jgi:alpha-amylase
MKFFLLLSLIGFCWAQYDPHTQYGRTAIVHLFEWRWVDIAKECERYLAPNGFAGVQVRHSQFKCCAYVKLFSNNVF